MSNDKQWRVAVLGATGLVGETLIKVLEERDFPVAELYPLASNRSLGKDIRFRGRRQAVIDVSGIAAASASVRFAGARPTMRSSTSCSSALLPGRPIAPA